MTTFIKFLISVILCLLFTSCNFVFNGVNGNGNVITEQRSTNNFSSIKATEGINVHLKQGNTCNIKVQADENLHDIILTEVNNGELYIHTKKSIGKSSAKKIIVTIKNLNQLKSTSGASIYGVNTFKCNKLKLYADSGSNQSLTVETQKLTCKTSS